MPLARTIGRETATKIATVSVIVALSWFAAMKERNHPRLADRGSYVIGLRTDLSCVPLPESAGALNILSRLETATLQNTPALDAPDDGNRSCTGNRRWSHRRVTFATLDAGRVCAKSGDIAPDWDSCAAHEETAVEWMRETFAEAEVQGSAAIMFIFLDGVTDGHTELWLSLREELVRFGRPVVDIHRSATPHRAFENLTSVATGGGEVSEGNTVPWMKITVDTGSAEVFSFASLSPGRASPGVVGSARLQSLRQRDTALSVRSLASGTTTWLDSCDGLAETQGPASLC
jgi:hypothetical protein